MLLRVDPSNSSRLWKLFGSGFPSTPQGATGWACFPGPVYPNATDPGCRSGGDCDKELGGCLFELISDPTEHVDVAASEGDAMQSMVARLGALQAALFTPDRGQKDDRACEQVAANGGFYGPWLFLEEGGSAALKSDDSSAFEVRMVTGNGNASRWWKETETDRIVAVGFREGVCLLFWCLGFRGWAPDWSSLTSERA